MSVVPRQETSRSERTESDTPPLRQRRIGPEWVTLLGVVALSGIVYWIVRPGLIDDAYITLSYARNLATHFQWGMLPDEVANTATAPLNIIALGAVTWLLSFTVGVQPLIALGVVFVAANVVLTLASRRAARACGLPAWCGSLAAMLVLINPLMLSTVGLEMTLAAALLAVAFAATARGSPTMFGIVAGLLVLTRIDLAVFAVAWLAGTRALRRGWGRVLVAGMAVSLPWFAFSWWVLGSAVPDTLLIKQLQDYWGEAAFDNGLGLYLGIFPVPVVLSLLAPVLAVLLLALWAWRRVLGHRLVGRAAPAALLGVGAVCHYLAYTMLGVPPYHWYYAPSIIGLSVALAFLLVSVAETRSYRVSVLAVSLVLLPTVFLVQRGVPWEEAPINTNGATSAQYARMGKALGSIVGDASVASPGEIGALAYYCECVIVDDFSDRGYLPDKIEERKSQVGPVARWLIDLNYARFDTSRTPRRTEFELRRAEGFGPDPLWNGDTGYHLPAHFVLVRK